MVSSTPAKGLQENNNSARYSTSKSLQSLVAEQASSHVPSTQKFVLRQPLELGSSLSPVPVITAAVAMRKLRARSNTAESLSKQQGTEAGRHTTTTTSTTTAVEMMSSSVSSAKDDDSTSENAASVPARRSNRAPPQQPKGKKVAARVADEEPAEETAQPPQEETSSAGAAKKGPKAPKASFKPTAKAV